MKAAKGQWKRRLMFAIAAGFLVLARGPVRAGDGTADADAAAAFELMIAAVDAVHDYQARWMYYASSSGPAPIWTRTVVEGKLVRSPARSYVKVVSNENNFNDPVKPGTQMIYDGANNEQLVLLPGLMQILGVIHIFAEDVKCMDLTGAPFTIHSLWDLAAEWQAKSETGELTRRAEAYKGTEFSVLTITFPAAPGERQKIGRIEIWVDPATNMPRRYRGFVEGMKDPLAEVEYESIAVNPGLTAADLNFTGLSLWDFPAQFVANAEGLDRLKYEAPAQAEGAPPAVEDVIERLGSALDQVKDYKAEYVFTQKYFRLRSKGSVTQSVIREPRAFLFEFGPDLRINHLHMLSAGGKVCLRRDERAYAAMGAGAFRAAGVQLMHLDDPRSNFPSGESFSNLNLFELLPRIKWHQRNGTVTADLVTIGARVCPRLIMKRAAPPRAGELQDLALILDPDTWLPLRVEYLGNLDPDGYTIIEYQSIRPNLGLKEEDLTF